MPYQLSVLLTALGLAVGVVAYTCIPEPSTAASELSPFYALWSGAAWTLACAIAYRVLDKLDQLDDAASLSQYKRQIAHMRGAALRSKGHEIIATAVVQSLGVIALLALEVAETAPYGVAIACGFGSAVAGSFAALLSLRWLRRLSAIVSAAKRRDHELRRGQDLSERLRPKTNGV